MVTMAVSCWTANASGRAHCYEADTKSFGSLLDLASPHIFMLEDDLTR